MMWNKIKEHQEIVWILFLLAILSIQGYQSYIINKNYNEMLVKTASFMKARPSLYC
jgi:hypothetical protein